MKKERADALLAARGLVESREKAKRLIMAGEVFLVRGEALERVDKPGQQLPLDSAFSIKAPERFVSRGGEKLETAFEAFGLDVADKVCLDVGASTGGFTDCLLSHGASKVYAVDVGRAQLHEKLAADPRVVSLEQVNMRHATLKLLPEKVDFACLDVSFISLTLVLPPTAMFLKDPAQVVALIKPQFELPPGSAVKGVVRDEELRQQAVEKVTDFAMNELGLRPMGVVPSKVKGPKGNQEFLAYFVKEPA